MEWPTEIIIKREAEANNCGVFMNSFSRCMNMTFTIKHNHINNCYFYINALRKCEEIKNLKK